MTLCGGLWLFFLGNVGGVELLPTNDRGQFSEESAGRLVADKNSPKLQRGEISGIISTYDGVAQKISVRDDQGTINDFLVDSDTPIEDHHLQISFANLHAGDYVTVRYNVDSRRVNTIERI